MGITNRKKDHLDMEDIYALINSYKLAIYFVKTKKQFNIIEAAVIIHKCNAITLVEKLEYFNILIRDYKDMEVRNIGYYHASFKELLRKRIEYTNKFIEIFEQYDEDCVYRVGIVYKGETKYSYEDIVFDSIKKLKDYWQSDVRYMKIFYDENDIAMNYRVEKKWCNTKDKYIAFDYSLNDEYVDFIHSQIMDDKAEEIDAINSIQIDIPPLFKKGSN